MGQKEIRVVLDTNVLVSGLLFTGPPSQLVSLWRARRIVLLLSKDVFIEYLRVLAYPKFKLSGEEIKALVDEYFLPFAEMVTVAEVPVVIREDRADDNFLALAAAGRARYIVSGDKHLLALREYRCVRIVTPREFLEAADLKSSIPELLA
jgi:putative PIN family toxin of toxin-antitoxin system